MLVVGLVVGGGLPMLENPPRYSASLGSLMGAAVFLVV
jgi:hypothetical protein